MNIVWTLIHALRFVLSEFSIFSSSNVKVFHKQLKEGDFLFKTPKTKSRICVNALLHETYYNYLRNMSMLKMFIKIFKFHKSAQPAHRSIYRDELLTYLE